MGKTPMTVCRMLQVRYLTASHTPLRSLAGKPAACLPDRRESVMARGEAGAPERAAAAGGVGTKRPFVTKEQLEDIARMGSDQAVRRLLYAELGI